MDDITSFISSRYLPPIPTKLNGYDDFFIRTRKESVIFLLGKYGQKTRKELGNLWYNEFPFDFNKLKEYPNHIDLKEKCIIRINAGWLANDASNKKLFNSSQNLPHIYSLTDEGLKLYEEIINRTSLPTKKLKSKKKILSKKLDKKDNNNLFITKEKFNDIFEKERIKLIIDGKPDIIKLLKDIYNGKIKITSRKIHKSMLYTLDRILKDYKELYINENGEYHFNDVMSLIKWLIDNPNHLFTIHLIKEMTKDPLRQNLSEKLQQNEASKEGIYMEKYEPYSYLYNGKIKTTKSKNRSKEEKNKKTKSIDFKINRIDDIILQYDVFTMNKYNFLVGGSLDNVKQEVIHFCENVLIYSNNDKLTKFIIILDGKYWDDNRRQNLKDDYENDNLIITCTDNISEIKKRLV